MAPGHDGKKLLPRLMRREEIVKISNTMEMLGLQRALWQHVGRKQDGQPYRTMCLELIHVLVGNPAPAAAECLARLALLSDHKDVGSTAAAGLKGRPRNQYVPLLLWALWSPIETAEQHTVDAAGNSATRYVLEQEGPVANVGVTDQTGRHVQRGSSTAVLSRRRIVALSETTPESLKHSAKPRVWTLERSRNGGGNGGRIRTDMLSMAFRKGRQETTSVKPMSREAVHGNR